MKINFSLGTNINGTTGGVCKDLSHITCFNYNKKSHYASTYNGYMKDYNILKN